MKKTTILLFGTALMMLLPMKAWSQEAYAWLSSDGKTFTFCYDNLRSSREGTTFGLSDTWYTQTSSVESVVFNPEFANVKPTSTKNWFRKMSKITEIPTLGYLDTSNVTDMENMFRGCSGLESFDVSNFNTASVTDMSYMFYECSGLKSLDISGKFNTASVTNMAAMFEYCIGLKSLDLSNFNTASVTDMSQMFYECSGLTSIDLSSFNTESVKFMTLMFYNCRGLTSLDVSKFNTKSVYDLGYMFQGCMGLTSLDLSNFDIPDGINTGYILQNCTRLHTLKISPSMRSISSVGCTGIGSPSNPCILFAPEDFDFGEGVDTSGDYFQWKSGYFKLYEAKIIISDNGIATFCYDKDLDFSGVTDYKAYVAGGYNSKTGNLTLLRANDVPAGTGILLKGTPGTYEVPAGKSYSVFSNLLIGTTETTNIQPIDGAKTNFVLSVNNDKVGFYTFTTAFDLEANKAYLQLPTSALGTAANGMGLEFEDETTDIDGVEAEMQPDVVWYTIDGRKLEAKPTQKGLYITNGRKVVVK